MNWKPLFIMTSIGRSGSSILLMNLVGARAVNLGAKRTILIWLVLVRRSNLTCRLSLASSTGLSVGCSMSTGRG